MTVTPIEFYEIYDDDLWKCRISVNFSKNYFYFKDDPDEHIIKIVTD